MFTTNLAHFGMARFTVPGLEADPLDSWRMRAAVVGGDDSDDGDGDGQNLVGEYFFALDPTRPDIPKVRAEIVHDRDGQHRPGRK